MGHQSISIVNHNPDPHLDPTTKNNQKPKGLFKSLFKEEFMESSNTDLEPAKSSLNIAAPALSSQASPLENTSHSQARAAYQKQENVYIAHSKMNGWEKYKDDQLLSNPGGDHYDMEKKRVALEFHDQSSFWGRVGKDISDATENAKNFFKNLLFGAKIHYRNEKNQIQEASLRGLVGSVADLFKDMGSAFSFGMWRPDGDKEPDGFAGRCSFFFSKMKEAIFGDLIQGVSGSILHMGEDLIFAGWNLIESIPDATIGNFEKGRRWTTAFFDTGQVALDYLTDILPSGDAWLRVHSTDLKNLKPPVLRNLEMPEHYSEDTRWKYVRNTRFRKALETTGSLLTDLFTLKILGQLRLFSEKRHQSD